MTTRFDLRDTVARILKGRTPAEQRVYTPGDWPTHDGQYPIIRVLAPETDLASKGKGGSELFDATATIRILLTVAAAADATSWGQMEAEAVLEPIERLILSLIVGNPEIRRVTSQTARIRAQVAVSAEGEDNLCELRLELDFAYDVGLADLGWDPGAVDLTEVAFAVSPDGPALTRTEKKAAIVALGGESPGAGAAPDLGLFIVLPPDQE